MLTQYSSADKRRVYLAYRTVFAGPNAQLRKHKKVREVILARQNAFRPLINDFGLEKIIKIVIILLNGRIKERIECSEGRGRGGEWELYSRKAARWRDARSGGLNRKRQRTGNDFTHPFSYTIY
jgi:hypothetical protein